MSSRKWFILFVQIYEIFKIKKNVLNKILKKCVLLEKKKSQILLHLK